MMYDSRFGEVNDVAKIKVSLNDIIIGGKTILAEI